MERLSTVAVNRIVDDGYVCAVTRDGPIKGKVMVRTGPSFEKTLPPTELMLRKSRDRSATRGQVLLPLRRPR